MKILDRAVLVPDQWDSYVEGHPHGWFWHTSHWLDYCLAYCPAGVDDSFAVADDDGTIQAVMPLVREGASYTMGGHPGASPLLDRGAGGAVAGAFIERYTRSQMRRAAFRSLPGGPCVDHDGARDLSWDTFVMDLRQPQAALWGRLRKSYHSLIHRVERQYDMVELSTQWAVDRAHLVHAEAAGRETRAQRTWDLMAQWASLGHVVVALAMRAGGVRGMAMAIRYKDAAYYASGATLDKDLSHALVWHLATTLQCGGVASFELGWATRAGDNEKDRAIAFFKSGFAADRQRITACELDV